MNPEDDPEARIRDLERPLADVARTSELGTPDYHSGEYLPPPVQPYDAPPTQPYGAYGAPPPMPPPAYGAPYPDMFSMPPQKAKSSSGALWFLFAGIAVVVVMMVGGVVIWSNMFKLDSATRPPIEIPIPSIELPSDVPGVGPLPEVAIPSVEAPVPVPGAALSVSGAGKNETLACDGNVVSVSGVDNTVTITGHCANLSVSGVDNVVTVDAVDSITASGFDNKVIYLSGSPEIIATGSNVVEQG